MNRNDHEDQDQESELDLSWPRLVIAALIAGMGCFALVSLAMPDRDGNAASPDQIVIACVSFSGLIVFCLRYKD